VGRVRLLIVALGALTLIILSGCGGGSGNSGTTPITKAQLISLGDKICNNADNIEFKKSVAYEQKHRKELSSLSSEMRVAKLLVIIGLPSILKEGEELEALGMPVGGEKRLEAIYAALRKAVSESMKAPLTMEDPNGPFAEVDHLAHAYGFKSCDEPA
jgi:hypothetical protein